RKGMSARSRRRSRAPDVSIRPKIPEILTVKVESSPCSGDSVTTSTGTSDVPMVSSRICASVRCLVRTRMIIASTTMVSPAPTKTAAINAPPWPVSWSAAVTGRSPPVPTPSQYFVDLVGRWLDDPPGSRRPMRRPALARRGSQKGLALVAEDVGWHFDAVEMQLVEDLRSKPCGDEPPHSLRLVHPVEDVLKENCVAL